jgi:hypothetical protein
MPQGFLTMPKSTGTIKVKSIPGEPMRFYVESWTNPSEPHLVDLSEHGGRGECSCTDWEILCQCNFKRHGKWIEYWGVNGKPNPDRTMCKHVHVTRVHVLNAHLKEQSAILHPVQPN